MRANSIKLSFVYILSLLAIVSCLQEERSPEEILVPSPAQVECSESAFSLTSKVPSGSEKLVDECGFLVGTTKDLADAVTVEGTLNANTFAADLPSRKYGTTYYICSYVTNGHGSEIRSDLRSFALEPLDKYVKFGDVTVRSYDLASKTAELALTADIWAGVEVSEAGLCYGKSEVLSIEGDHAAGTLADDGAIYITIKGFVDGDKYCLRPYLMDGEYLTYGAVVEFSIPAVPVVRTNDAAEITSEGSLLSGEVVKGADISERGFMLAEGESSAADMKQKKVVEGTIGEYSLILEGLLPNQKYTYCAYAVNPTGTYYGPVKSFTTKVGLPVVTSVVASSITSTSATLSATVKSHGGETVSEVGFYYSTDEAVDIETATKVNKPYSESSFDLQANELAANTKYYVKAYAVNSAGVGYSQTADFTTSAGAPSVTTLGAKDVTSTGATLSGTVIADNGAAITERGFVWMQGTGTPTTDSFKLKVDGTTGDFTSTLDGLEPNQKFSFRAYAINSKGTSYGDIMTFTTVAGLPILSAMKVSAITTTSATFTCAVTGHGGDIVSEVGFYIGKEESVDIETALKISEAYTSDSFTLTATDLEVGTDYYVKAFTKNSVGESYSVIVSFKTVSTAPSVTTVGSSEITDSSVLLSGEVTDDNGEAVTERGFVWLKGTGTPTTSNNKLRSDGTTGEYSSTLSALEPNQTYSFRSYAVNAKGTAYGETMTFRTEVALPEVVFVSCSDVTSSSAIVSGKVTSHGGETVSEVGFLYGTTSDLDSTTSLKVTTSYTGDSFSLTLTSLTRATEYYIQPFVTNSAGTAYGEVTSFTTLPELPVVTTNHVTDITDNSAVSGGVIVDDGSGDIIAKGVVWSRSQNPTVDNSFKTEDGNGVDPFTSYLTDLTPGRTYYVRAYATNLVGTSYGDQHEFRTTGESLFEALEAANCFIISESGTYAFESVKGNSYESVGSVFSAEVLWESYGTSETPVVGSLVSSVSVQGDMIVFKVPEPYREGNAVIAAKDANGTILWSWHIWLTDQPQEQIYNNNAGTMMDRNLGATSATPGDVGALGLLYQWGRKDPFLGYSSVTNTTVAESTISWPSVVSTSSSVGTVDYTVANPTTYITAFSSPYDWHYSSGDNTLWQSGKTIYDPCPAGYRVPDGGGSGVWSIAHGSSSSYIGTFDSINRGFDFSGDFGEDATIWYPCAGYRTYNDGSWSVIGYYGHYWSVSPNDYGAYRLRFDYDGNVGPSFNTYRADGNSVRCLKEGTGGGPQYDNDISISGAISLSDAGTANSYIVSSTGTYSIPAVKGNSSESVGSVASAEVLWETFGTDEKINIGSLVSGAKYENGQIYFKTADSYREGNAVIAAKDASGTILWSWHIWLTDQPQEQIYNNNAGTMMDRNLGATIATAGDVGALGLLYQWGRKDPFLGSASISSEVEAQSTITWPSAVSSDSSTGTVDFVTSHPTTFVKAGSSSSKDWHYSSRDNTLWQSEKTIYDPCPVGWRVPDDGDNGVWATAKGSSSSYNRSYDSTNKGMSFSGDFGLVSTIWYPAPGYRSTDDGALVNVGGSGHYWSVTPHSNYAYSLYFNNGGSVIPTIGNGRANGFSVRCLQEGTGGGPQYENDFSTSGAKNLSEAGTANSYIVSNAGTYSISPVKGNSSEPVGSVASAEVLWETFGTDEKINIGSLVSGAKYENGQIYFKTADSYREGNAVIAAKDASGTILWSWHIWLTDQPQGQIYNNNAGTMMDRNLGATIATAGDVGALGLLYQWGRKDPFLGSASISSEVDAQSTIAWPSYVTSNSSNGTIEYAISHPTTFIKYNSSNHDWYYTGSSSTDDTRWQSDKTIYDPCPSGWRVPDGGDNGVWATAKGSSSSYNRSYDSTNKGMNFSGDFGSASTIWYPASGFRSRVDGALNSVGNNGYCWSVVPNSSKAYYLYFGDYGDVNPTDRNYRAFGFPVRCLQESE